MIKKTAFSFLAVVGLLMGGAAQAVERAPETVEGATTIDVVEALELFEQGVLFVDPRKASDYDAGHVPGAVHMDLRGETTALTENALLSAAGSKNAPLVFYCNGETCMRSSQAAEKAVGWSFSDVYYFRSGFPAWLADGLPVE